MARKRHSDEDILNLCVGEALASDETQKTDGATARLVRPDLQCCSTIVTTLNSQFAGQGCRS